jgi:lipopolysaccharide biosynthesis glycosyltransferase
MRMNEASTDPVSSAVIVCSDGRMVGPACCTLLSCSRNLGELKARLFLLTVDVDDRGHQDIQDFAEEHGIFIDVLKLNVPDLSSYDLGYWGVATIARLYMDSLIPPSITRLVYLDADTLVVAPMADLFAIDMEGHPVAAVDDCLMAFPHKMLERKRQIGMSAEGRYFNAGVLVFDWTMLRETDLLEKARNLFLADPDRYPFNDQDVLNVVLDGNWAVLDPRWNTQTGLVPIISDPAIKHFTGSQKPWKSSWKWMHRDARRFYRETLRTSAWAGFCSDDRLTSSAGKMMSYLGSSVGRFARLRS